MGNWDIIFCRNVTIYFRMDSTRRVVENFFESLNPGGYLFIGHSETLTSITDRSRPVEVGGVFLHRKPMPSGAVSFGEVAQRERRPARKPDIAPETAGEDITSLLTAARSAALERRPHEALQASRDVLAFDDDSADAHFLAAKTYADDGDFDNAFASAEEALRIDPLHAAARYILGLIHLRSGRPEAAIAEFRRTAYVDDTFVLAHFNLGNLHRSRGEYAEACRKYEAALKALERAPEGPWSAFLGGFEPDVLAVTCGRSLEECRRMSERG
jgi:chemotaxis protein methyltransferase CheR